MPSISTNDFKNGMSIELSDGLFQIQEFQHVKPGKGGAFVRMKLRQVKTGAVVDKTFRGNEKFDDVRLERTKMQFLYEAGDEYHFMNNETYDQVTLTKGFLGNGVNYLKESMNIVVMTHEGNPVTCELPTFVELKVAKTDPGVRGDTASGGTNASIARPIATPTVRSGPNERRRATADRAADAASTADPRHGTSPPPQPVYK